MRFLQVFKDYGDQLIMTFLCKKNFAYVWQEGAHLVEEKELGGTHLSSCSLHVSSSSNEL